MLLHYGGYLAGVIILYPGMMMQNDENHFAKTEPVIHIFVLQEFTVRNIIEEKGGTTFFLYIFYSEKIVEYLKRVDR